MKKRYFLYILPLYLLHITALYAQNEYIRINQRNQPAYKILEDIESKSRYSFIYDANVVNLNKNISIQVANKTIVEVLDFLFKEMNIAYTIINNHIILTRKVEEIPVPLSVNILRGIITDSNGDPVVGANIVIKGTTTGTSSDLNGNFRLSVPIDSTIRISYLGYMPETMVYTGQNFIRVKLEEDVTNLKEILITALGIQRKEASIPYATQLINERQFSSLGESCITNLLTGKIAGVQINRSASGHGGSTKVSIRGYRSVSGNNQPLYVIDGIPILNSSNEQPVSVLGGTANAANRDGGDGISNLNLNDIESISILKGASSAALYGSQAANGVILITTKKGLINQTKITYSAGLTMEQVTGLPGMQNQYGKSVSEVGSWGEPFHTPVYDHVKDFFRNGTTAQNAFSIATGSNHLQSYLSYANTVAKGILENNLFSKHNLNVRERIRLFNSRLSVDANVNLITQKVNNKPSAGGMYMNPLSGLYTFPRGTDISEYKTNFEKYSEERNIAVQNWAFPTTDQFQNPYWLINRAQNFEKRTRVMTFITAKAMLSEQFSVQARGNIDHITDFYNQKIYATTSPEITGNNGRYIDFTYKETQLYADLLATYDQSWDKFSFNGVIGTSINDNKTNSLRLDSKTASLYYANVFTISNVNMTTDAYIEENINAHRQLQSLFSTFQWGYANSLFLTITGRNDWSSTLAYTPSEKKGFFYPSLGISWIVDEMIKMPKFVSYGKLRVSWSKVGNDLPLFVSNSVSHIGSGGAILPNETAPFGDLKPEINYSIGGGTEWRFFDDRLFFDLTLYKINTVNQLFTLPASAGAAYKYYYVNAGNVQNTGIEIITSATPVLNDNFNWNSAINFSRNRNKIIELHKDLPTYIYSGEDPSIGYSMRLKEGGSIGDIYGKVFRRDANGVILTDANGIPLVSGEGNTEKTGNCLPDFMLGWSNSFHYKDFTFSFLIDGRFGGEMLSLTQAVLDRYGVSESSGKAREKGYLTLEGKRITAIQDFYDQIGDLSGVTEYYMYDATNIRLREISVNYALPQKWMKRLKAFDEINLSLTGRNMFFFYKKAPFDPDVVFSTGNNNQGVDIFGMPLTRSIGFNLKITL